MGYLIFLVLDLNQKERGWENICFPVADSHKLEKSIRRFGGFFYATIILYGQYNNNRFGCSKPDNFFFYSTGYKKLENERN